MVRMTNKEIAEGKFRRASDDASAAKLSVSTPQTESEAYKLAFQDTEFLLREDLRPVRFQLELLKPALLLDEAKIESTFVFYGSARIPHTDQARSDERSVGKACGRLCGAGCARDLKN